MREQLITLYQLQAIDSQVLEVEKGASSVPDKIRELEGELEKLRTELGALNTEVEARRKEQREIEGHIAEESAKHKKWRRRLNEIKTPREYQALSRETELGERQVKELEESVLKIMGELESKQKVIQEKDSELRAKETETNAKIRDLRAKHAEINRQAQVVAQGRVEILKRVPEPLLKKYQQIRERRNGIAVALVVDKMCKACNVQLRPQFLIELRRYTSVENCPSCHRLLVPEELVKPREEKAD